MPSANGERTDSATRPAEGGFVGLVERASGRQVLAHALLALPGAWALSAAGYGLGWISLLVFLLAVALALGLHLAWPRRLLPALPPLVWSLGAGLPLLVGPPLLAAPLVVWDPLGPVLVLLSAHASAGALRALERPGAAAGAALAAVLPFFLCGVVALGTPAAPGPWLLLLASLLAGTAGERVARVFARMKAEKSATLDEERARLRRSLEVERAGDTEQGRRLGALLLLGGEAVRAGFQGLIQSLALLATERMAFADRQRLEAALASARAMAAMIEDLVADAEALALRHQAPPVDFDLAQLSEGAVALLAPAAQARAIALQVEFAEEVPRLLRGDPRRLRLILACLLDAALTEARRGPVALRLALMDHVERRARLMIAAQAPGEEGTGAVAPGTLPPGLALSQRLVQAMGGEMGQGREQDGSLAFWVAVTLPLADGAPPPQTQGEVGVVRGLTVLVAEDLKINQLILTRLLAQRNHAALVVEDGGEALALVQRQPVDLVILDVIMPGIDGLETARRLRRLPDPRLAGLPVIGISATGDEAEARRCLEAGMDDFLAKPIGGEQLFQAMDRVWQRRGRGRALPLPEIGAAASEVLDIEAVRRLLLIMDETEVDGLVQEGLMTLDQVGQTLAEARAAETWSEMEVSITAILGVSSDLGLAELAAEARRLERVVRLRDHAALPGRLEALAVARERAATALEGWRARIGPAVAGGESQAVGGAEAAGGEGQADIRPTLAPPST